MNHPNKKHVPKAKRTGDTTVNVPIPDELRRLRTEDSEQIERAVYDGMHDLRVKKPGRKPGTG